MWGYFGESEKRWLREDNLTLDQAIVVCRADEVSKRQIQKMNEGEHGNVVHAVKKKTKSRGFTGGAQPKEKTEYKFQCNKCGIIHEEKKCPVYGNICHKFKLPRHFSKMCKSKIRKDVHNLDENSSESDYENLYVGSISDMRKKMEISENECFVSMDVNRIHVKFKIDTGSQTNVITNKVFKKVKLSNSILVKSNSRLISYIGDRLKVLGKIKLTCLGYELDFYVTDSKQMSLLGFKVSQDLGLIKVVLAVNSNNTCELDRLIREHPKVFSGLGCLE